MAQSGTIIKALSGFYYVSDGTQTVECRARGIFRKRGTPPLVGDRVLYSRTGSKGVIDEILPRRNELVRPAVANLDALVVLASAVIPVTEPFLIDRVTAIAVLQDIEPIICVNKCDLDAADRLTAIYRNAGFPVVNTSALTGQGLDDLWALIRGKTVAFTGNSGVGKSALLGRLCPELQLQTGEVSAKLGRGRHTTRHVELFALPDGTFAADTPGFSSFDTEQMELTDKDRLQYAFPEFAPYLGSCRFPDCSHLREPGCGVLQALAEGRLEPTRHQSYERLYQSASQIKPWERKQD